ncbi:MAG: DUF1684 domain-containing protein [Rhodanobacteraceae bacterium]|nr:DUF1684 domain-containing protein [Rhodanobacteraceae bacterium]MBL0041227.1 DUF1684 domain-containing protein [Xanthomonadales bacterium]MBP6077980.1 DUF1684 domain-containing protein [Xanthomonadales bacterium]
MRNALIAMPLFASALLAACTPTPSREAAEVKTVPTPVAAAEPAYDHAADVEAWRSARLARLQKPDGWLSLIGLHWLVEGEQTLGHAAGNDIELAAGPDHFGTIRLSGDEVLFAAADGGPQVLVSDSGGERSEGGRTWHVLAADVSGKPSLVSVDTVSFLVIKRGDKHALRVRDSEAPTRKHFTGIEHFPVDDSWRIVADWTPHTEPKSFGIQTVIGTIEEMPNPGYGTFTRDGREYRIYPVVEEGSDDLFIIFADRTSGKETYGPGRFVYAPWPKEDGKLVIDFNKAYNPPCALNAFSTCPLPPPENRLDLRVTAGEKKYEGAH